MPISRQLVYPVARPPSRPLGCLGVPGEAAPAAPTHPLSYLFGVGDTGRIFDGTLATFFTDAALTSACTTPGVDPVGGISHFATTGAMLTQPASANKPLYIQNGTAYGFRSGTDSGDTWMEGVVDYSGESTLILLIKRGAGAIHRPWLIYPSTPYAVLYNTGGNDYFQDGAYQVTNGADASPEIAVFIRQYFSPPAVTMMRTLQSYDHTTGLSLGSVTGGPNDLVDLGASVVASVGHASGLTGGLVDTFFELFINRYLDPTEVGYVTDYISGNAALAGVV